MLCCNRLMSIEQSRVEIALQSRNKRVYCRQCDLSSQKSIRQFAEKFKKGLNSHFKHVYIMFQLLN